MLSHLLVIKRFDFCSPWVINPAGFERLRRGSRGEAFLMDSHRDTSIHRANEIGLWERGFGEERENSHGDALVRSDCNFSEAGENVVPVRIGCEKDDLAWRVAGVTLTFLTGTHKKRRKKKQKPFNTCSAGGGSHLSTYLR